MNEPGPLVLLLALALAACSSPPADPPLAGAAIGGPFTLTDQDGRRQSSDAFAGRWRILYFGFANCPDVCPTDLAVIARGLAMFEKAEPVRGRQIQPIMISVDPERDSPARLKAFVANFHPRLIGLTGSPQEIAAAARAHGVHFARALGATGADYAVDHSRITLLMDKEGKPVAMLPTEQGAEAVAGELERWVR